MTRTELIVQLLKVAIGLAFGAYFVWWSLEVLDRLAPENEEPTPAVGRMVKVHAAPEGSPWMWTLAFGHHEDRTPTHGYEERGKPRWPRSQKAGGANETHSLSREDIECCCGRALPLRALAHPGI
jgi:hypothetical protein